MSCLVSHYTDTPIYIYYIPQLSIYPISLKKAIISFCQRGKRKKKKRRKGGKEERKGGKERRKRGKGKGKKERENMKIV
jgi:hypothetical protein